MWCIHLIFTVFLHKEPFPEEKFSSRSLRTLRHEETMSSLQFARLFSLARNCELIPLLKLPSGADQKMTWTISFVASHPTTQRLSSAWLGPYYIMEDSFLSRMLLIRAVRSIKWKKLSPFQNFENLATILSSDSKILTVTLTCVSLAWKQKEWSE